MARLALQTICKDQDVCGRLVVAVGARTKCGFDPEAMT
jgi:hypothetical protein